VIALIFLAIAVQRISAGRGVQMADQHLSGLRVYQDFRARMVETFVDILGGWLPGVVSVSANPYSHIPVRLRTGRRQALLGTFQLRNPANDAV
jgi:hypothetical protein